MSDRKSNRNSDYDWIRLQGNSAMKHMHFWFSKYGSGRPQLLISQNVKQINPCETMSELTATLYLPRSLGDPWRLTAIHCMFCMSCLDYYMIGLSICFFSANNNFSLNIFIYKMYGCAVYVAQLCTSVKMHVIAIQTYCSIQQYI